MNSSCIYVVSVDRVEHCKKRIVRELKQLSVQQGTGEFKGVPLAVRKINVQWRPRWTTSRSVRYCVFAPSFIDASTKPLSLFLINH